MRNIILCDLPDIREDLMPLSFTRPISEFRVGITTLREKWERYIVGHYSHLTVDYLSPMFPCELEEDNVFISAHIVADESLSEEISLLSVGDVLMCGDEFIALRGSIKDYDKFLCERFDKKSFNIKEYTEAYDAVRYVYDVFLLNGKILLNDYRYIVESRKSCEISSSNIIIGDMELPDGLPAIFLEEGAQVEGSVINLKYGPVYVGSNSEIMEGSCIRGALALCRDSKINMGSKIYGPTTIGPVCKVGGELNNVVFFGYSNKAHDGFLGNAVIGEWCNIGAGSNASNLKNDYTKIRIWNYRKRSFVKTDLQFCGLIMGDHSKIGVNCMINTATVFGVGVNLHGSGFPRAFVPSFSEGSPHGGFTDVSLDKFFDIATRVLSRRGKVIEQDMRVMFERIFSQASKYK